MINVLAWANDWQVLQEGQVADMHAFATLHHDAVVTWCPQRYVVGVQVFEGPARHAAALIERKVRTDGTLEGHVKVLVLHTHILGKLCQALYMAVSIEDWQHLRAWEAAQQNHCMLLPLLQAAWFARGTRDLVIVQGPSELLALGLVDNRLVHASAVVFSDSVQDRAVAIDALARRLAQEIGSGSTRAQANSETADVRAPSAAWLPWSVLATPEELASTVDAFARTSGLRCELVCRSFRHTGKLNARDSEPVELAEQEHGGATLDAQPLMVVPFNVVPLNAPERPSAFTGAASPQDVRASEHSSSAHTPSQLSEAVDGRSVVRSDASTHEMSTAQPVKDVSTGAVANISDEGRSQAVGIETQNITTCSAFAPSSAFAVAKMAANDPASKAKFLIDSHTWALFVTAVVVAAGLITWSGHRFWQAASLNAKATQLAETLSMGSAQNRPGADPLADTDSNAVNPIASRAPARSGDASMSEYDVAGLQRDAGRDLLFLQALARSDSAIDIVDLLGATRDASAVAEVRILGLRLDDFKEGEMTVDKRAGTSDATASSESSSSAGSRNEPLKVAILDGRFAAESSSNSRAAAEFARKMKDRGYLVTPLDLKGPAASLSESSRLFSYRVSRLREAS